jgi:hypothetical protein
MSLKSGTVTLVGLCALSCGHSTDEVNPWRKPVDLPAYRVDPELKPVLDQYMADAAHFGLGRGYIHDMRKLIFADFPENGPEHDNKVGVCTYYTETEVKHPRHWWNVTIKTGLTGCYRDFVVYHELTHCVYQIAHSDDPESVMYPYMSVSAESCADLWQEKMNNLFVSIKRR